MSEEIRLSAAQEGFLAAFANNGNVLAAAKAAGIHRATHYKWLEGGSEKDPVAAEYRKQFEDAQEDFRDRLRHECARRAVQGWQEPVTYQGHFQFYDVLDANGQATGERRMVTITKFSDRMLELALKAKCPEFKEKAEIDATVNMVGNEPLRVEFVRPADSEAKAPRTPEEPKAEEREEPKE